MHLKKGKKNKFFYILLIIFLTSTNNYNFKSNNLFSVKNIIVKGFTSEKNIIIKDEIKYILGKNIFFLNKNYFTNLLDRNDTKDLTVKKKYPNKLIIDLIPAIPMCIVKNKSDKIILGNNGKRLNIKVADNNLPIVQGTNNFSEILNVVNLLNLSKLDYHKIKNIIFFRSGRFDINLENAVVIKFPINYNLEIINYSNDLLNNKIFADSKIIDLRIKNKIIKYE